jgi:mono/diheme cytochrome c family protein
MIPYKYFTPTRLLLLVTFFVCSFSKINAQDGKALFLAKCASCHSVFSKVTGPALGGFQERENGKWADIKELTKWVHNPAGYMKSDAYTTALKAEMGGAQMNAFPELKEEEIKAIADYINVTFANGPDGGNKDKKPGAEPESSGGALIFGIISLIMALIALVLMQVNSNLKKLSDDTEGILRPDPVPFYKNKVYIALFSVVLLLLAVIIQPVL